MDGPGKTAIVVIWADEAARQVQMRWGLKPVAGGRPIALLRAENRQITRRCLIVMNELFLRPGTGGGKERRSVEPAGNGAFFCCAGSWEPESDQWPAAFAGITVEAYPDIAPYQDRHMAIVRETDWQSWLTGAPAEEILRPWPAGSLRITGGKDRASGDLFEGL